MTHTKSIDWSQVKALSFDCYGTLVDWERGILAALKPWVRDFGEAAVLSGFSNIEPSVEHAHPTWPYRQVIAHVYAEMADELQVEMKTDDAFSFAISVGTWPPFEDTLAALAQLKKKYKLFILSNVDEVSISGTLAQLETEFDGVYTAELIGSYKPDSNNFRYLLEQVADHDIKPENLIHVAQSLFHDHVPAQAMGLKSVWIDRNNGKSGAAPVPKHMPHVDARFSSLADFADHAAPLSPS
jgi:2-haloacid dehalogenase